jgi:hypothetical protein
MRCVVEPEVQGDTIVIPPARMKAKNATAVEHLVPTSSAMQQIIAALPRCRGGKYLFSQSAGARPLALAGPIKRDLDQRMLRSLKAMARRRGEAHFPALFGTWRVSRLDFYEAFTPT